MSLIGVAFIRGRQHADVLHQRLPDAGTWSNASAVHVHRRRMGRNLQQHPPQRVVYGLHKVTSWCWLRLHFWPRPTSKRLLTMFTNLISNFDIIYSFILTLCSVRDDFFNWNVLKFTFQHTKCLYNLMKFTIHSNGMCRWASGRPVGRFNGAKPLVLTVISISGA